MKFINGTSGTLHQRYYASDTGDTIVIASSDTSWSALTQGVVLLSSGKNEEHAAFTGVTDNGDGTYTLSGVVRGLDKDATSYSDATATNKKTHEKGTVVQLVLHSVDANKFIQSDADYTITGDYDVNGGSFSFGQTTDAGLTLQSLTTSERDALIGVVAGAAVYNETTDKGQYHDGTGFEDIPTGATVQYATESQAGVVEYGTPADNIAATEIGESGAHTVLTTKYLITESSGPNDSGKVGVLNALGEFSPTLFQGIYAKWGGNGSDGAQTGALAINASEGEYVVKNYTSMTPGNNTISVTAINCVVHIKVSGDADFTNTTFSFAGRGGAGGDGGETNTAALGQIGTGGDNGDRGNGWTIPTAGVGGGGGQSGSGGTAGTGGVNNGSVSDLSITQHAKVITMLCGGGGGGGGGGGNNNTTGGGLATTGGDGGNGGGCVILEIAGNVTFSSTTVDCSGTDGGDGVGGSANWDPGAGAGGGAGGTFICLYGGTLTGSVTPDVSGGSGGSGASGGSSSSYYAGGGGGGGASVSASGTDGTSGTGTQGGDGGDGADGAYLIAKNTAFF